MLEPLSGQLDRQTGGEFYTIKGSLNKDKYVYRPFFSSLVLTGMRSRVVKAPDFKETG